MVIDTGGIPLRLSLRPRLSAGRWSRSGPFMIGAVTHLDVTVEDCGWAGQLLSG